MLVRVDPTSKIAIYEQIAAEIRRNIAQGEVCVGDRLPTGRNLADALGVNVHTVLRAYQQLRDDEVIELRRGRGAVVASGAPDRSRLEEALATFVAAARTMGFTSDEAAELVRVGMQ